MRFEIDGNLDLPFIYCVSKRCKSHLCGKVPHPSMAGKEGTTAHLTLDIAEINYNFISKG